MIRAKALTADPSFTQYVDVDEDPGSWEKVKRDAMGRITVEDGTDRRAVRAELKEVEEDDIDRDIELEDQMAEEAQEREQEEPEEEEENEAHTTDAEKEYGKEWAPW